MQAQASASIVLTLSCPDRPGVIHAISGLLLDLGYNIVESQEFHAHRDGMFFMRVRAQQEPPTPPDIEELDAGLAELEDILDLKWRITPASHTPRALILVSKYPHCLNDLLFRASTGRAADSILRWSSQTIPTSATS